MRKLIPILYTAFVILVGSSTAALAWHAPGHELAARVAVAALPEQVPAFFREATETIARQSIEPDLFRELGGPELAVAESPEHFFDLELLQNQPIPANRYAFIALCAEMKLNPRYVGTLPYSVTEWTQKLTAAFVEYRANPNDAGVKARCLVYAGILAHYSADLCQPLHVTIDFDGRATDGKSPHSGIHDKVDALPNRLAAGDVTIPATAVKAFDNILSAAVDEITRSNALVGRVYELEKDLPPSRGDWAGNHAVTDFTKERMRASAAFTASLFLTAWENSARGHLPEWAAEKR